MSHPLRAGLPLLLLLALAAAPPKKRPAPPRPSKPVEVELPAKFSITPPDAPVKTPGRGAVKSAVPTATLGLEHTSGATKCGSCHQTSGWTEVKFNHERTGFPLKGHHLRITCVLCHTQNFEQRVPNLCSGCHEDAHAGDLGVRCDACHDESGWRSSFSTDAHRRSGFPLVGAHAAVACLECHPDSREQRFSRPAVDCVGCHRADQQRLAGSPLDHQRLGLGTDCGACHGPVRFSPAAFPGHDSCFLISAGPHAALGCLGCHSEFPATAATGTCATHTAACTGCHEHQCAGPGSSQPTDRAHAQVLGYQCADRKCFECHQFGTVAP